MGPQGKKLRFDEISNSLLGLFFVGPHLLSRHRFEGDKFAKETVVAHHNLHTKISPNGYILGFQEPSIKKLSLDF